MHRLLLFTLACSLSASASAQGEDAEAGDLEALLREEVETAAAHRQDAAEAAASVTVITADEIDRLGYRTLADILSTVRGFTVTDDRTYSYVGVRGFGRPSDNNSRVALFIDGVPSRNGFTDAAPLGLTLGVPLSAIDRVEVTRGPGSTLYGTGAMFGVVNVILKDTRTLDGVRGAATLGAYGSYEAEAFASTDLPGGVGVTVGVHGLDEDGPETVIPEFDSPLTPGGLSEGLDYERTHGVTGSVERGPIRLDVRYGDRTKGLPTAIYRSSYGLESSARDRSGTATLRATVPLSPRLTVSALGAFDRYDTELLVPYGDQNGAAYISYTTDASFARAGSRVQWTTAAHRLTAGVEALSQFQSDAFVSYVGTDQVFFEASDPFLAGGVYAQSESAVSDLLALTIGGRLDAVRGDVAFSPRGAVVVTPDDRTSLKLLAGSAFRSPSTWERTLDVAPLGQFGAGELGPEYATSYEAILGREVAPGLRLEGSVYSTYARDLVENRLIDPATGTFQYQNAGQARGRGAELGATAVAAGWRTRASYGYHRVWDPNAETDAQLLNAPVHAGKATAFGPLGGGLWLALDARAESARRTLRGTETDPFAVFDAALSADVLSGLGRVTAGVRNVLDTDYALPARPEHRIATIPQRPRTFYLRLDARL